MEKDKTSHILESYLSGLRQCIDELEAQDVALVAEIIYYTYLKGGRVYILGNGGSAATASHLARDLRIGTAANGKRRVKAISLADSVIAITSLANDVNYESIFTEQLAGEMEPQDLVIAISCSGNSANVLAAASYAREVGATTIAFTGFGGGKLKDLADVSINFATHDYGQAEDMHMALGHIITYMVREKIITGDQFITLSRLPVNFRITDGRYSEIRI